MKRLAGGSASFIYLCGTYPDHFLKDTKGLNTKRPVFSNASAHAALWSVALIYAINYFVAKWTFEQIPPLGLVSLRMLIGLGVFGLIQFRWIKVRIQSKADYIRLFFCGIFGASLNQLCFFLGLSMTIPVNASALMITAPVFVFIIAMVSKAERLSAIRLVGLICSFLGAYLLVTNGREVSFGAETWKGDVLVMVNAASYGLYLVIVKPLVERYHFITIVFWVFVFGSILNIPLGFWDLYQHADWQAVDWAGWGGLAYILIGTTVLTYFFNGFALTKVPSSIVGIYIYLQPVLVALLTAAWSPEDLTWMKLSYMILVMIGVVLVTYRKKTFQTTSDNA